MRTATNWIRLALALACAGTHAGVSSAELLADPAPYYVYGQLAIAVQEAYHEPVVATIGPEPGPSASDAGSVAGAQSGSAASAHWLADLALGRVAAYATSHNGEIEEGSFVGAAGAAHAEIKDTLHFIVPAGSYPLGAWVMFGGMVEGTLDSAGGSLCWGKIEWNLWAAGIGTGSGNDHGVDAAGGGDTKQISHALSAMMNLLPYGTTYLSEPRGVDVVVLARLDAMAYTYESFAPCWGLASFGSTLQLGAITAPPGVTWTSESGGFLPEPGASATALAAVAALAAARRKTRPLRVSANGARCTTPSASPR